MKNILSIVGARPQFIKSAIVSLRLRESGIEEKLLHTGQHYDHNMSDIFFQELEMKEPEFHLGLGSGSHGEMTGRMLMAIEKILIEEKPDLVMVYGDTNTTLAGALAATKLHIPVAHVEAGLRSFNRNMPEEINRVLTDHASDLLFCPTITALDNLKYEGFMNVLHFNKPLPQSPLPSQLVANVGDVMFDLALMIRKKVDVEKTLAQFNLKAKDFILATIHRAENTDNRENLKHIWEAFIQLAENGKEIFFPLHPRTRKALDETGLLQQKRPDKLHLSEPITYKEIIALESSAKLIITDSGGIQKEGYFFETPVVVAREQTEWVEVLENDWGILCGSDKAELIHQANYYWEDWEKQDILMAFGNGNAARKIAELIQLM